MKSPMTIDTPRSYQPGRLTVTQMRERQSAKIRELRPALVTSGIFTLDEQAETLGLSRSTAWNILNANHKTSGLSAATIHQMLAAPRLPPFVRVKILEYCEEKATGQYGHSKSQRRKFISQCLTLDSSNIPSCNGRQH
jgi:phage pi2 protein 07